MSKRTDALRRLFERAGTDAAFRRRLLADPKGVIAEHGFVLPDDAELTVHENTATSFHVVLPPPAEETAQPVGIDLDLLAFFSRAEFDRTRESRFDRLGRLTPLDAEGPPATLTGGI